LDGDAAGIFPPVQDEVDDLLGLDPELLKELLLMDEAYDDFIKNGGDAAL
jgi:hypothetical protein